jgi:hexosaminidase
MRLLRHAMMLAVAAGEPLPPGVVPQPRSITYSGGSVTLAPRFAFAAAGQSSAILSAAFGRYEKLLNQSAAAGEAATGGALLRTCTVDVSLPSLSLDLETDESYTLELDATKCTIAAKTVFGAMHGMESLAQLVRPDFTAPSVRVDDKPRFPFRCVSKLLQNSVRPHPNSFFARIGRR